MRYLERTAKTLKDMFGYVEVARSEKEAIYQSVAGQAFGEIVVKQLEGPSEKPGRGSIHHLAIRVKNEEELRYWDEVVKERGFHSSGDYRSFLLPKLIFP